MAPLRIEVGHDWQRCSEHGCPALLPLDTAVCPSCGHISRRDLPTYDVRRQLRVESMVSRRRGSDGLKLVPYADVGAAGDAGGSRRATVDQDGTGGPHQAGASHGAEGDTAGTDASGGTGPRSVSTQVCLPLG